MLLDKLHIWEVATWENTIGKVKTSSNSVKQRFLTCPGIPIIVYNLCNNRVNISTTRVNISITVWIRLLQGEYLHNRVNTSTTGWISQLQGEYLNYRVNISTAGWIFPLQGEYLHYRVNISTTGWISLLQGEIWMDWIVFSSLCGLVYYRINYSWLTDIFV